LGAFCSEKFRPNNLAATKNRSKYTLISSRFGLLFLLKWPNFDQKFLWARVFIYQGSIFGRYLEKLGVFFTKLLVTLEFTLLCTKAVRARRGQEW
jgi:hypothetical protein